MIPNPTKTITINKNINEVMTSLSYLQDNIVTMGGKGYNIQEVDTLLNRITIQKMEFLSLGVNILIDINSQGDNTSITIEVQRALGAFDQWHEVTLANNHLNLLLKAISFGLKPKDQQQTEKVDAYKQQQDVEKGSNILTILAIISVTLAVLVSAF
jgi:hypothetical protein